MNLYWKIHRKNNFAEVSKNSIRYENRSENNMYWIIKIIMWTLKHDVNVAESFNLFEHSIELFKWFNTIICRCVSH